MKFADPGTDSVLILLTVPAEWRQLPVEEIARKLRQNQAQLIPFLAAEVKRWAGVEAFDLDGLQGFIDERRKEP